ncbi:MAG: AmmeMemoRadiSam system protein B [Candidatus Gracilibacteria bacterium]
MGILKKLQSKGVRCARGIYANFARKGWAIHVALLLVVMIGGIGLGVLYQPGTRTGSVPVPGQKTPSNVTSNARSNATGKIVGAVLPHHLLVANFIDDFYAELAKQIKPARIILISPNHFDKGVKYIQTATVTPNDQYNDLLDLQAINFLASKAGAFIENKYYSVEHGIYVHYPFIKKYFPQAQIIPITLKRGTPQAQMDKLIADLQDLQKIENKTTLILASVDFTHYVSEDIAAKNDQQTIAYFTQWASVESLRNNPAQVFADLVRLSKSPKEQNPDAVAIDSPESIYVMLNYLNDNGVHGFSLWKRTSTLSLTTLKDPNMNTSHIFGKFL